MKRMTVFSAIAFLSVGLSGMARAEPVSLGEEQYKSTCAVCHGLTGKGDGPFAEYLKNGAPSLASLSKDNAGIFPFNKVYGSIDGRVAMKGHGPKEMPVWGKQYLAESVKTHGPFFGEWYGEDVIRARILALVEYIASLQE